MKTQYETKGLKTLMTVSFILMITTTLPGIFSEAVRLNEEPVHRSRGWFGGTNSFRKIGYNTHYVYSRLSSDSLRHEISYVNIESPWSPFTINRAQLDDFYSVRTEFDFSKYSLVEPIMEVTPDESMIILYPRTNDSNDIHRRDLHKLLIDQNGNVLSQNSLHPHVYSEPHLIADDSKINLLFRTGYPCSSIDLSAFHKFIDISRGTDDRREGFPFHESHIIDSRFHSNSDIWLKRNDWPTFHGLVTTSGQVRVTTIDNGTDFPEEEIFLGGFIENHEPVHLPDRAEEVRNEGIWPFGRDERDDAIAYVTVNGNRYSSRIGEIREEDTDDPEFEWIEGYNQFTIYDSYPPYGPVGEEVGVNRISRVDTIWTEGPEGIVENTSVFVPMELWISGSFEGKQTWASSHDIYLKGDLTYENTPVGQKPDDNPVNETDFLGIISEKSIYIKYGHWCPVEQRRMKPNTEDIYMYGAYGAFGESHIPWEDGVLSFEYQYPKGSTPDQVWNGERYTNIDLHLFKYPTSPANPWPPGLDYPWYNPLWPEPGSILHVAGMPDYTPNPHNADPIAQNRGNAWLFGSVAQRRRGNTGITSFGFRLYPWDIDNEIRPHTRPTYGSVMSGYTGYNKKYFGDSRFNETAPPHFPRGTVYGQGDEQLFHYWTSTDGVEFTPVLSREPEDFHNLKMAVHKSSVAILDGTTLYLFPDNSEQYEQMDVNLLGEMSLQEMILTGEGLFLLASNYLKERELYKSRLYNYCLMDNSLLLVAEKELPNLIQTIHELDGRILWAAAADDENITLHQYTPCPYPDALPRDVSVTLDAVYTWEHGIDVPASYCPENSVLAIQSDDNELIITVNYQKMEVTDNNLGGNLYSATGAFLFPDEGIALQFPSPPPSQNIECRFHNIRPEGDNINPEDSPIDIIAPVYWEIESSHPDPGSYNISFNLHNRLAGVNDPHSLHLLCREESGTVWQDIGQPDKVDEYLLTWEGLSGFSEFSIGGYGANNLKRPYPATASNPGPADNSTGIEITLEELSWCYEVDIDHVNPLGFRVYFGNCEEFEDSEDFSWIPYVEEQEGYSCCEILPEQLDYDTTYYWKVVPTTKEDGTGEGSDAEDIPVWFFTTGDPVSIEDEVLPAVTELRNNYPNPFNPDTIIEFSIREDTNAKLSIYNTKGQLIKVLHNGLIEAGKHKIVWNGKDSRGRDAVSGVYFYRLQTDSYDKVSKMLLVK